MREQSQEWKYVVILEKKEHCQDAVLFCDKVFTGGALRIREHLSGTGNFMIKACGKVPDDVAEIMRKRKEKNDAHCPFLGTWKSIAYKFVSRIF